MTTATETRRLMEEGDAADGGGERGGEGGGAGDRRQWVVPLMDFVDDFRFYRDPAMIAQPFETHGDRLDALLAGVIQCLCDELQVRTPRWVLDVGPAPRAWFVSGMESLKATALVETPLPLRMRRVFVLGNFLQRV